MEVTLVQQVLIIIYNRTIANVTFHIQKPVTITQICKTSGLSSKQVSTAVSKLIERNLVWRFNVGEYSLTVEGFDFVNAGKEVKSGPYRPRSSPRISDVTRSLRHRAWIAMRRKPRFTISELMIAASDSGASNERGNIASYVTALSKAGYVKPIGLEEGTAPTSNGFKVWRLVKDTGELPPLMRKGNIVDRNTQLADRNLAQAVNLNGVEHGVERRP